MYTCSKYHYYPKSMITESRCSKSKCCPVPSHGDTHVQDLVTCLDSIHIINLVQIHMLLPSYIVLYP